MNPFPRFTQLILKNKDKLALVFSALALVASFGKEIAGFILPVEQLTIVVTEPTEGADDDDNPLPISKEDGKLRLDPRLHIAFINSGTTNVLVRSVSLISPNFGSKEKLEGDSCESEKTFNMAMYRFEVNFGESRKAAPFSVAPGEIVSVSVDFKGIPDITNDVNIANGIPICIHLDTYDFRGRHHELSVRAFDITVASEEKTTYVSRLHEKGIAVMRFSQLWSMLH